MLPVNRGNSTKQFLCPPCFGILGRITARGGPASPKSKMISLNETQSAGPGLIQQVENVFSGTGILSKASNFEYRPQQQQMAVAVARALEEQKHLAVEAGTGVGKSLAYLVPAILFAVANKKKAIVSTHTINLQEQLTRSEERRVGKECRS